MLRLLLSALAVAGSIASAPAQSLKDGEVLSSISVQPISAPNPVRGADGRIHLAYELLVANTSRLFVTLDKLDVLDPDGKVLSSLQGDGLKTMTQSFGGTDRTLAPGSTAALFLDVLLTTGEPLPRSLNARLTATRQAAGPDGKPAPWPADAPLPATFSFIGAETAIGKPAVAVQPPLRGKNWLAVNGCCDAITSHRGAVMAVNGRLRVPERFAIDWIQLDADNRAFTGPADTLSSFAYYGAPIHAAADGIVVNLYDEADEQTLNAPATGITPASIGGNMLVIDIGGGNYTFYAHLQRDSLKVKSGDRVRAGDVIGLLGNTGNSSAPHLHFHVMDGPSPLDANGLPYVFTHFTGRGVLRDADALDDVLEKGLPAPIDPRMWAGRHNSEMPLNNQLMDFE